MVFSSVTPFVDHHNWHQQLQQSNPQGNCGGGENVNFQSPPPVPPQHGDTGGEGSIRPGSMVDRARLAKLPMPEPGLNCPRCDSTNTKFCYFNNYSLTQPRHFCKACRRYWTRGGALRNVPVGGGCRRNKRSSNKNKRQRSNSPTTQNGSTGSPSNENIAKSSHQLPSLQFPFMSSSSYGGVGSNNNIQFPPAAAQNEIIMGNSFRLGSGNNLSNMMLSMGSTGDQSWRLPFLAGFEVPNNNTNLYDHYQSSEAPAPAAASSSMVDNSAVLKVEEKKQKHQGLNLSRQVDHLGINISEINTNQEQPWQQVVGNNWAGFSSLNTTTSSSNPTTNFI